MMVVEGYFPILVFMVMAVGMAVSMPIVSFVFGPKRPGREKLSQYECGFAPFADARHKFDVRFYLLSILFIVFDIEAAFLFPWAVAFKEIGFIGFVEMMLFLLVLLVGYVYAWKKGALEWE